MEGELEVSGSSLKWVILPTYEIYSDLQIPRYNLVTNFNLQLSLVRSLVTASS